MLAYIWPIALVVAANTLYHIVAKSTPTGSNAFLSLTVTYLVACVCSFALFLFGRGSGFAREMQKLNWTSVALGVCIIGLELGYIYVYRAGWKVNTGSLVANISLAVLLLAAGFFLYKEAVSARQLIGIAVCIGGLVLVTA